VAFVARESILVSKVPGIGYLWSDATCRSLVSFISNSDRIIIDVFSCTIWSGLCEVIKRGSYINLLYHMSVLIVIVSRGVTFSLVILEK
jgi:hypothetical protein